MEGLWPLDIQYKIYILGIIKINNTNTLMCFWGFCSEEDENFVRSPIPGKVSSEKLDEKYLSNLK